MTDLQNVSSDFPALMEALLAGHAVCEHRYPRLYDLLAQGDTGFGYDDESEDESGPYHRDRVAAEDVLEAMNRRLARIGEVYCAIYSDYDASVSAAAEKSFAYYTRNALLISEFFDLIANHNPGQESPLPGDRFAFTPLLADLVAQPQLKEALMRIASQTTQSKDPPPDRALRNVVDLLERHGFLVNAGTNREDYVVTGELALFDRWRDFVAEIEEIELDDADAAEETTQDKLL